MRSVRPESSTPRPARGRRSRSCRPSPEAVGRDLIERDALEPGDLPPMRGELVLAQALERLALARRPGERVAPFGELELVPLKIVEAGAGRALGVLEVGLAREQVGGADRLRAGRELSAAGLLHDIVRRAK